MDIITTLAIIVLCLLLEGFFSGSEIGVISADQMALEFTSSTTSGVFRPISDEDFVHVIMPMHDAYH